MQYYSVNFLFIIVFIQSPYSASISWSVAQVTVNHSCVSLRPLLDLALDDGFIAQANQFSFYYVLRMRDSTLRGRRKRVRYGHWNTACCDTEEHAEWLAVWAAWKIDKMQLSTINLVVSSILFVLAACTTGQSLTRSISGVGRIFHATGSANEQNEDKFVTDPSANVNGKLLDTHALACNNY